MAESWIKIRTNLATDPRVSSLCDLTEERLVTVLGGLQILWAAADEHTKDGYMPGLSIKGIDRSTGILGFGTALVAIGWIEDAEGGVRIIRFSDHNGESAKKRIQTAKRVAAFKSNAKVTEDALLNIGDAVTDALPREELEIREDLKPKAKSRADATASRLPADWAMTEADAAFCIETRPELSALETAARFRDYWHGVPGAKGRKSDWPATWRNWVRNERATPQARAGPQQYQTPNEKAKAFANSLTGKNRNERPTIIDINDAPT